MKIAFLKTRASVVIIALVVGLFTGFKIANSQYRNEQGMSLNNAVAQASGQAGDSQSTNTSSNRDLTPEQRNKIINETRLIIEKAKKNPQDIEAQLNAADQFIQINRPDEAIPFLQQANKVKADDPRPVLGLGMVYFLMDNYNEAISWSKRSLALSPKNPGATLLLSLSYIRTNQQLGEAERMIRELEASRVDQSMVARARGELEAARSGKTQGSGANSNSRTMLDHGPETPRNPGKNGGRP